MYTSSCVIGVIAPRNEWVMLIGEHLQPVTSSRNLVGTGKGTAAFRGRSVPDGGGSSGKDRANLVPPAPSNEFPYSKLASLMTFFTRNSPDRTPHR